MCLKFEEYQLGESKLLIYKDWLYIPNSFELRNIMMYELHQAPYSAHLGCHIMITVVRKLYFWPGMKKDVVEYITKCQKCQKVKMEHQHPIRVLQPIDIPEWNKEIISMDFAIGFPMIVKQHDSIIVVVEKLSIVAHFIPVKSMHKANNRKKFHEISLQVAWNTKSNCVGS